MGVFRVRVRVRVIARVMARVGGDESEMRGEMGLAFPVTLKLECLQHTGSFKARGAFNKLLIHGILDLSNASQTDLLRDIVNEKNMESTAFAWLAYMREKEILFDNSGITGSKQPYLLGNVY